MKKVLLLSFSFVFILCTGVLAQTRSISGKVTGASDGIGLPGVNVILKGTTTGTTTDIDGNYRLSVPDDAGVLVFSFIGLKTQDIEIGARSVIDVSMKEDVETLSEVVVTAYGIERPADEVAYQTEQVDSKTLMQGQQQVVASGLAGKVAGLQVNVQSSGVNPQTQILLRGLRSISNNNEALVIIDGSIASLAAFNDLNPQDIESVNIIKGATGAALYGANASNGAVVVTTKSGTVGQRFKMGLNSSFTVEEVAYLPDFQSEYGSGIDGHYDPVENLNWGPRFDGRMRIVGPDFPDDYVLDDQVIPYAPIKDNLRDFYQQGSTLNNTLFFSGGDESGSYYLSLGNVQTKGIVEGDEYERITIRANADKKIGKLKLGLRSSYFADDTDVHAQQMGDQNRTLYWFVLNTPQQIPLGDYRDWENPASYAYKDNYYNAYYQNPWEMKDTNRDTDKTNRLVGNISAEYEITENIKASGRMGIDNSFGSGKEWRDAQTYDPNLQCCHTPVSSYLIDSEFQRLEVNANALISGSFNLTSEISLKPIVGAAFIDNGWRRSTVTANNLSIPGFYDISNGTGQLIGFADEFKLREYGIFADVTLGWREQIFLNLAGRQDYTSTLPTDDNGYFYPAASLSVILSEMVPAITANGILSFVKLTASNATVYNDLGAFQLNERYTTARTVPMTFPFPFGAVNGFEASRTVVDSEISKEKLNTTEFGWNLGFLNDRFQLNGSVYRTTTTDLITFTSPSFTSGAESFLTNIGKLVNDGIEVTVSGNILRLGDFTWDANVNFTSNELVVKEIKDDLEEIAIITWGGGNYGVFAQKGEAFPQLKAQAYQRDPNGRVVIDPANGNPIIGEVEAFGKTTPDYIIGATSAFGWKGISVSATIDYRTGHVYYEQGSDQMEFTGRSLESVSSDRQDFVFPNSVIEVEPGVFVENTSIPVTDGVMGFWQNTYNEAKENYVKDATALKIRELQASYSLPKSLLEKTGVLSEAQIGFIGRNLWTRLPDENRFADPEFNNTGVNGDVQGNGIGIGGYFATPPTRSFGAFLNLTF